MTLLANIVFCLAAFAACMGAMNLLLIRTPRGCVVAEGTLVSILIPARNEEANIRAALESAVASVGVSVEIVVMDDGSTDATAAIVAEFAARDPRVRLEYAPPLPSGWTGKVHACQRLADAARGTHLLFIDADVTLSPDCAARLVSHVQAKVLAMASGVPRQVTKSLGENFTVPMINFLMLGYLPVLGMRMSTSPGFGAACGQLVMVEHKAYDVIGGHGAIRDRLHDGIHLARRFRRERRMTDVIAGHDLASCRMYRDFNEAWDGFIKNAHEGMATPVQLPVWTVLLGGAHVLPFLLAPLALFGIAPAVPVFAAIALSLLLRVAITLRTRENLLSIPLHPVSVGIALAIQWCSLLRARRGHLAGWKGRTYPAE
jgi:glycosyltransferase involved in cell wall biosynthesis